MRRFHKRGQVTISISAYHLATSKKPTVLPRKNPFGTSDCTASLRLAGPGTLLNLKTLHCFDTFCKHPLFSKVLKNGEIANALR